MVFIPTVLGLGFLYWTYHTTDTTFKLLLSFLSAFGVGIGVNHFTTIYKEQKEFQKLEEKAEYTVRNLNDRINSILRSETLTDKEKDTVEGLLSIMGYWKNYYDGADTTKISYHRKLKYELISLETETIKNPKKIELIKSKIEEIEMSFDKNGVNSYLSISGNSFFNATIFK